MRFTIRARVVVPSALMALALVSGCGGGSAPTVSADVIRSTSATDVQKVLTAHNITVKGTLNCEGKSPPPGKINVFDCFGTTSDGRAISATLNAQVSGKSCTGPMVVNVGTTQIAALPNEKCS
jgi:hypothetical protein